MIPDLTGVLAHDRTLPVVAPLAPLLPDGALTRGRTFACSGVAATSLSLSLAVEAVTAGGWLAVVDLPWVGIEAAAELGVALERLVRVDGGSWAETVAALVDGFAPVDVMLTTSRPTWHGVADGHGRLEVRRIDVESSGRRIPQPRRATLWLPGPTGALATATEPVITVADPVADLQTTELR